MRSGCVSSCVWSGSVRSGCERSGSVRGGDRYVQALTICSNSTFVVAFDAAIFMQKVPKRI